MNKWPEKTPEEEALSASLRAALRRAIITDLVRKGSAQEAAEAEVVSVTYWEESALSNGWTCSCAGIDVTLTVSYQDGAGKLRYWEYDGDMAELMRRLAGE